MPERSPVKGPGIDKELRKTIAEGGNARCPLCENAKLVIEEKELRSGSIQYNYSCSNKNCELKPGHIKLPWYAKIFQASLGKLTAAAIAIIGTVATAAMIAATAFFGGTEDSSKKEMFDQIKPSLTDTKCQSLEKPYAGLEACIIEEIKRGSDATLSQRLFLMFEDELAGTGCQPIGTASSEQITQCAEATLRSNRAQWQRLHDDLSEFGCKPGVFVETEAVACIMELLKDLNSRRDDEIWAQEQSGQKLITSFFIGKMMGMARVMSETDGNFQDEMAVKIVHEITKVTLKYEAIGFARGMKAGGLEAQQLTNLVQVYSDPVINNAGRQGSGP